MVWETLGLKEEEIFTIGEFGQEDQPLMHMKKLLVLLTANSGHKLFQFGTPSNNSQQKKTEVMILTSFYPIKDMVVSSVLSDHI